MQIYSELTDEQSNEILGRLAPNWRTYLHDGILLDEVLDRICFDKRIISKNTPEQQERRRLQRNEENRQQMARATM